MSTYNILLTCTLIIFVFLLLSMLNFKNIFDNYFRRVNKNYIINPLIFISAILIIISFLTPYFYTDTDIGDSICFTQETGWTGDTIGGIMNPFIAIAAAILTFLAFWVQFKANQEVQKQFKIQQFESQLYQMIELYRKNADEMKIAKIEGRKCFAVMLEEFKFIYLEAEIYLSEYSLNEKDLTSITYCIFYYGVGNNIKTILEKNYSSLNIDFGPFIYRLEMIKSEFDYQNHVTLINDYGESVSYTFKYKPFKGHLSRLGHYYRHLFQSVKYVITQDLEYDEKYKYLKLLRSQISDYEYIFLFYNSLFEKGNEWLVLDIFTEYRFIKNIPLELLNFGLNPKELFEETNSRNEKIFE